ncbi:hypothetical protein K435DRAFT_256104 [Dendrothele bispora CBS 962.96]|uniref:Uncharacterized protein n=1 Tax=Dendrothele bispora (strain CBS 962.96) TaxID=1314807 RepID=A0A4S8LP81_DENBC|nr:hypothetical protein K435DRAFT_256104 [Dendrothele bispora CBS 962.96]
MRDLHENFSQETLSVHRLSSFPFVTEDPFASFSAFPPSTPDSPLLPVNSEGEPKNLEEELALSPIPRLSSAQKLSQHGGSAQNPPTAISSDPNDHKPLAPTVTNRASAQNQSSLWKDTTFGVPPERAGSPTEQQLKCAWDDCVRLYEEAIREESPISLNYCEQTPSGLHSLDMLQAVLCDYDLDELFHELDVLEDNGGQTGSQPRSQTNQIPISLLQALWPDEHPHVTSKECTEHSDFERELDAAFDHDFSPGELKQPNSPPDLQSKPAEFQSSTTREEESTRAFETSVILYEFICVFFVAVVIYATLFHACFGRSFLQSAFVRLY